MGENSGKLRASFCHSDKAAAPRVKAILTMPWLQPPQARCKGTTANLTFKRNSALLASWRVRKPLKALITGVPDSTRTFTIPGSVQGHTESGSESGLVEGDTANDRGVGTRWVLKSLPPQIILWFSLAVCVLAMNITQLTRGGPKTKNGPVFQPGKLFNCIVHASPRFYNKFQVFIWVMDKPKFHQKYPKALDYHTFKFSSKSTIGT